MSVWEGFVTYNDPNPNKSTSPSLCLLDMCKEPITGIGRIRIKTSLAIEKPAFACQVLTTLIQWPGRCL